MIHIFKFYYLTTDFFGNAQKTNMTSKLSEFEYDIFISYRHNDNKYEKWVTDFVTKLRQELLATCKGHINIYFDENPHDGLLETHDVDRSLAGKLNSKIFIPIVSQTYCDLESFAWKHEFKAFKEMAANSQYGLQLKLPSGNVASRILPVKIHDIDHEDVKLLETELDGVLRSIDFIYKNQGVNRPLRSEDGQLANNLNHTIYRNQINKVANAIKELIAGFKNFDRLSSKPTTGAITDSPYTATVPENLSYQVVDTGGNDKTSIFLAWTSSDLKSKREEIGLILKKAGFHVLPGLDCPADEEEFMSKCKEMIAKCDCSLHILSGEFGRRFEIDDDKSFPQFQLEEAKSVTETGNPKFKSFIWYTPDPERPIKSVQEEFIKNIRNNITRSMTFSNSAGPMPLVDDIRSMMKKEEAIVFDTEDTDIFFIFNQQDELDAQTITDFISNEYPIEIMNILPDGEEEYKELSAQQIPKSKLAVVYFKYAADWAIPFIKQVWKSVGGASSPTHLMLVGEDEPVSNKARSFKAPKVMTTITSKKDVAAQIKKVYTHVINLD
jgi:hypothetical protein